MKISLLFVCVAATAFLLWVLLSLVREWRSQKQATLRVYMAKISPAIESKLIVVEKRAPFRIDREGSTLTAIDLPAFQPRWP